MNWTSRLSVRERRFIQGAAIFLVLVAAIWFFYLPLEENRQSLAKKNASQEKVLKELWFLVAEYRQLQSRGEEFKQLLSARPRDFSIFSFVEKQAADAGVKGNIRAMNVARSILTGPYEEVPLEIRMDRVTLNQLTHFLSLIEHPEALIQIKRISISRMKEPEGYLTLSMQLSTYRSKTGVPETRQGGRP